MSTKSTTPCPTPRCVDDIAKHGELYHGVYDRTGEAGVVAVCERCGGKQNEFDAWIHRCRNCGNDVPPGALTGLFVPHSCTACMNKIRDGQRAAGRICRMCNSVIADCCC